MARGFLGGLVIGGAVSVVGAGVLSVIAFPPTSPELNTDAPVSQGAVPDVATSSGVQTPVPLDSAVSQAARPSGEAPKVDAPARNSGAAISDAVTTSAARPQTGAPDSDVNAPEVPQAGGAVDVAAETPVLPAPQAAAPKVPTSEDVAILSTTPAVPSTPVAVPEPTTAPEPEPETVPDAETVPEVAPVTQAVTAVTPEPAPQPTPEPVPAPADVMEQATPEDALTRQDTTPPEPDTVTSAPDDTVVPAQPTPQASKPEPEIAPVSEPEPETTQAEADIGESTDPQSEPEAAPEPASRPEPETASSAPELTRPSIGTPATNLLERRSANRLPTFNTVGNAAQSGRTDANSAQDTEENAAQAGQDEPALQRYAVPFDDADGRPLMSIILMDSGQDLGDGPVGLAALGSFPYALTFAVDAGLSDAAERMALYRSQGFEVMAMVDLPAEFTAADTEVALTAALQAVPESVAVMEGTVNGLQATRDMSDQVSVIAAETGHGLVWQPKGLDTAQKLAAREGIASQTVFRDFDSADQTPTVIRRFLDQAAFKAGQQGAVIMVGRLRPDTISALLLWGLQDRASRVAVAPVSAVLSKGLTP